MGKATRKKELKRDLFIGFLLADRERNQTRAAQRAGISPDNPKAAAVWASRMMKDQKVIEALEASSHIIHKALEVDALRIRRELARIAFFDVRRLCNDDGTAKPLNTVDDDTAAGIAGLEVIEFDGEKLSGRVKKYRISNKVSALELLGKEQRMFTDRVELTSGDKIIARLLAGRSRASAIARQ